MKNNSIANPRRKNDLFLILSVVLPAMFTAVFIAVVSSQYQKRVEEITLSESRFLTAEWHLLQELKAQTDQQLQAKEKEIEELNLRYMKLARGNASSWELWQFEVRLQKARKEREEILSRRKETATAETDPKTDVWTSAPVQSANQTLLTRLYLKRIAALEKEIEDNQFHIKVIEDELKSLSAQQEEVTLIYMNTIADKIAQIKKLSEESASLGTSIRAALGDIRSKAREAESDGSPRIEELNTRALIRAIASSQVIRSRYPDLLESLDHYFDVYAREERNRGRHEAFSDSVSTLEMMTQKPAGP